MNDEQRRATAIIRIVEEFDRCESREERHALIEVIVEAIGSTADAVDTLGRLSVEAAYAAAETQNTGWTRKLAREHGIDMEARRVFVGPTAD